MLEHMFFQGCSNQVRRVDSKFLPSLPRRTTAARVSPVCNGYVSGPSPVGCGSNNEVAMAAKDEDFAVMLVIQFGAYLRPSELCNLTAGQVIRHLSIAIGKVLTRYTAGKAATTPLWNRSQAKYAVAFAKWAETSGVHVITTHPFSVRHGGASSDLWRPRSLMQIQKRGRWRSEKSVPRNKETAKLSTATRKYW